MENRGETTKGETTRGGGGNVLGAKRLVTVLISLRQILLTFTHIVGVKKSHQTCKGAFGIKFLSPVFASVSYHAG